MSHWEKRTCHQLAEHFGACFFPAVGRTSSQPSSPLGTVEQGGPTLKSPPGPWPKHTPGNTSSSVYPTAAWPPPLGNTAKQAKGQEGPQASKLEPTPHPAPSSVPLLPRSLACRSAPVILVTTCPTGVILLTVETGDTDSERWGASPWRTACR